MTTALIEELFETDGELADELRDRIVALGTAAEAPLRAIIDDESLLDTDARGGGWAPIHALELLGELRATAAIPRMLELVRSCDFDEYAFGAAAEALEKMGAAAVEPVLAAYAAEDREEYRAMLASILGALGVRDERIWDVLVEAFARDPVFGAASFVAYRDARALPLLSAALDAADAMAVVDLAGAIEDLGGRLTPAQQRQREAEVARRKRMVTPRARPMPTARPSRPGRNDPCHCGSGKKYKKCHLESDERADAAPAVDETVGGRPFSRGAHNDAVAALIRRRPFDAREAEAPPWAAQLLIGYSLYGARDRRGRRYVDRFAEEGGRQLGRQERLALEAVRQSWASLYEVAGVERGVGMVLFDLVGDETITVHEQTATYEVEAGDWLFAWLLPIGDRVELLGLLCAVPEYAREAALAAVRAEGGSGRDRGAAAGALYDAMVRAVEARPMPRLQTTNGEELLFCKAHFGVLDEAALRRALDGAADFHADETGWVWLAGDRVLGHVKIAGAEATLEVLSRERLADGKARLLALAPGALAAGLDSLQSVEAALRERPRDQAKDEPLDEEHAELAAELLRRHYDGWADVPLPALDGKTPRRAVRSAKGRERVRLLVDEIERRTWTQAGGDRVDLSGLREELGLDDDLALRYEAHRAPDGDEWLDADEDERIAAVAAFHRGLEVHPPMPNPRLHALVHVVIENQLAAGVPAATRAALARLRKAGLSRHEALHAIGEVVAADLFAVMREKRDFDGQAFERALAALRPGKHAGSAPR